MATPTVLFGPSVVPTSAAAIYTSPPLTVSTVTRIVFTNVSAGPVSLTVWIVRSGGSRLNGNIVIGATSGGQVLPAGPIDPYVAVPLAALVLAAGDALHAVSNTGAALNAVGSGWTQ